ncbi:MAG TPA: lipid II flippase MurJ [Candidatus Paceibacterota bacterium]|jgi:putative peptidoglycan lipid II flippase|nr:lipid II flippase MurJ [Candidatus Paceibacterota bacterium]HPB60404.1 lipid II flippase MurJ [Candidatus Paceibacterota bacterium]HPN89572.1 lipid II flippase MurJ [Candidatus Paceibacterota bacterium]HPY13105.1 lipid II flippase MurJ [Candidatus Paceibacterota bacterium]HQB27169.1 lipid II flippase MurJ [Candidatus Paceibacterota bacterium]
MVNKVIKLFRREVAGLHEAAILLGLFALTSQFLGLIRDRLLAGSLGAGTALDIYYSSFRIPDLIFATIASFVSVTVLIPLLSQKISEGRIAEARNFMAGIFSSFLIVMAIISSLVFLLMPFLAEWLAPGFDQEARQEMILLSRILLLSPILLGLSNLYGSITQAYKKFLLYSLCPVFYNLGIIVGIVFFLPRLGLSGIVWGVILGSSFHFLLQVPSIIEFEFWPRLSLTAIKQNFEDIKKVVLISLPRTITLSINQIALFFVVALASVLGQGAISIFNLSFNLQSVPSVIFGVSYSVAAFPTLSNLFYKKQMKEFLGKIREASQHIIFWSLPATALFIVLRAQIVRVILGSGEFGWTATRLTAACLALFSISVVTQGLVHLFVRAYYAGGLTKKPLFINVLSSLLAIVSAFGLVYLYSRVDFLRYVVEKLLRVENLEGSIILMLPLAFSLGSIVNVVLMLWMFKKDFNFELRPLADTFIRALLASLLGGAVSYQLLNWLVRFFDLNTFVGVFAQGFLAGLGGIVAMFVALWFLRSQELKHLMVSLRHKFWKVDVVRPEPEEL